MPKSVRIRNIDDEVAPRGDPPGSPPVHESVAFAGSATTVGRADLSCSRHTRRMAWGLAVSQPGEDQTTR
jgi:hypothetical protein